MFFTDIHNMDQINHKVFFDKVMETLYLDNKFITTHLANEELVFDTT